ncbi:cold shock domain-containing protein [Rhodobacteraceae bacterium]|nr:cold shock domain-containing protein [Paracoccaceae bacterium]
MNDGENELKTFTGRVKWFDSTKGFGFLLDEVGGADVLLHGNVLRNFGQGSVADGAVVTAKIQSTSRGRQAVEVLTIAPPVTQDGLPAIEDLGQTDAAQLATLPIEAVRVKWFDPGKGFGFANAFGRSEDIFIHIEVLRQSGFADLSPGEAVCMRVIEGRRGRMAAQVLAWESAQSESAQ